MEGLLIVLIGLLLGVTTYLVRYYLAVKSLSKQIEEKLVEESHRRITLKNQPKSLVTLTNQVESLFTQIEKTNLVHGFLILSLSKKRKPWTWLSVILPMIYERH